MLMLGLDSIDWKLVNEWVDDGRLPVLGELVAESSTLLFGESIRALPGSVWTDIATGASAAFHGFVHEEQTAVSAYRPERMDASHVAVSPFYKCLSDAGIRCAVVDFPVDYPLAGFNGVQVVDWGTEFKLWHFETRPSGFAAELVSRYGNHPLTNYGSTRIGLADLAALKSKLLKGIEVKQRFAIDLLRRNEHEFIFFNFAEIHKAGHFFWRFHDRAHPDFTEAEPRLVDALRDIYEATDRALGEVLANLDSTDDLIVVTDRGMYANHRGDHLVDPVLMKLGVAVPRGTRKPKPPPDAGHVRLPSGRRAKSFYRAIGRALPESWYQALLPFHRAAIGGSPAWDWQETRVFRLPSVGNSYLRVNLSGRDAEGIVSPGEYDALLTEIAAQFRALVNPATGERAVESIYFPASQLSGPKSAALPDVAILWNSAAPIHAATSADIGMIEGRPKLRRSGNHRPEGFALLRGPSFGAKAGPCDGDPRQLAPMILRRFGVPPPPHFELLL
jgi:predicted AlkP superfamily phosphohydrolase/phosphomutase